MYYELYVDSLFTINFIMNLYLLYLTDISTGRTATRKGIFFGSIVGAVCFLLPFFLNGRIWWKFIAGGITGSILMISVTFNIRTLRGFLRVSGKMFEYAFLIGGILFLVKRYLPFAKEYLTKGPVIALSGAFICLLIFLNKKSASASCDCLVTLRNNNRCVKLKGFVDSGNSLMEPISKKPVSVIEKRVLSELFENEPEFYRAVPYHSIGKKKGIMKGYSISFMQVEAYGIIKAFEDVYIAVAKEGISLDEHGEDNVGIIINPRLFE